MFRSSRSLIALTFIAAFSFSALGQEAPAKPQWRIYASDGRSMQNWHGQAQLQSVNFERSKKYRWNAELGTIIHAHVINQPRTWLGGGGDQNVPAVGMSLLARHRFTDDKHFAQPFVEVSSGPMWATERVPAATSHFNFLSQLGVGYVFHSDRHRALVVGWRFGHISNAGYGRLNSGLNINSLMVGTQFR